ncbi:MAG: TonB-dependent receptor [Terracidiphilus sp.]|jgi:iron complex outermembrane receptor protein
MLEIAVTVTARIPFQSNQIDCWRSFQSRSNAASSLRNLRSSSLATWLVAVACLGAPLGAYCQTADHSPTNPPTQNANPALSAAAVRPSAAAQQVPRLTTTVEVHGEAKDDYLPDAVAVGTLNGSTLKETPLSATVITRDLLNDQVSRLLSDVVKNDASVDDDYVPVGYYGWYEIRGFAIDLATGLEINGMTIAGEQDVPLENKERVEILKGIAGLESGVANAGGLINYVTKRPAAIKAIDLATDHRGSTYGAADVGWLLGSRKQVGARFNLGGERIASYMNDTNGWRALGAGAADWKLSPMAILKGDFEYQHKVERDGSGYQLLGGATVPDINQIYPSTMLGDQPWGPPDTYNTFNTSMRLDYTLPHNWAIFGAASYSHSLIEDNVIYAYGTPFDANGNVSCPNAPDAPAYFFCPDGSYGIYDYRDPGELRKDEVAEAILTGHVKTGPVIHDVAAGGEVFLRSVQQPGFYTMDNPYSSDGIVQDGAVYAYVGSENIYQPTAPVAIESPLQSAGPRRLWEDSHQAAAILQDRIHLPGRIQLIGGGRYDALRDHNYSGWATSPCTASPVPGPVGDPCPTTYPAPNQPNYSVVTPPNNTDQDVWLPFYAATYAPVSSVTLYGNYSELLSLGPQAAWWVDNANQFLAPYHTRQAEIGAKYEPSQRILLTTAFFRTRAPFFYPESDGAGGFEFVSQGRETHDGIEANVQGKAANWLRLTASAAAINATSDETGTPAFDGKQVINVPHLHTTVFADLTVPHVQGLHLMPGWSYSGRKEATRDDTVSVPSVNIFNLGARYTPGGEEGRVTFRIYANNIADKKYWSDTGTNTGDSFLWLGAPTTVRLSAHYTF